MWLSICLEAEGLDSTTLGLMAKLGLHCRKEYGINVQVFLPEPEYLAHTGLYGF